MREYIFKSEKEFSRNAADYLEKRISKFLHSAGRCSVILSGGSTPSPVYTILGKALTARSHAASTLFFFIGDERYVPRVSPNRNDRMIVAAFGDYFTSPSQTLFAWEAPPLPPEIVAARYDGLLESFFHKNTVTPDLTVLGLGTDGHTASLFPGSLVLRRDGNTVPLDQKIGENAVAVFRPDEKKYRVSLTAGFLKRSKEIVFLVGGENKGPAFRRLREHDSDVPASWVLNDETSVFALENSVKM